MPLIELNSVHKIYGSNLNKVTALHNLNLKINKGELLAIVGPSGSGKSTLLNIIGTLDTVTKGEYLLNGKNINNLNKLQLAQIRNKTFGFVVQHFALISDYTVFENVEIPLEYAKVKLKDRKSKIENLLVKLEMQNKVNCNIKELSGGQCQRVAIARALANNPEIILADEPTGALDQETGKAVLNIFKDLNKQGKTIIIVTHDYKIAEQCNRIIKMEDGNIIQEI
ncbi:ABC transporter ATP-binding protein [Clostridium sp. A1-XYC3]|uniref:ABC transporter ATP-binding protein n=1 Tax=Clostridium tanneri TaxID=3037988 RepID=A0ABU4JRU4_9CLOT|nr:ABC transporter ATP-binding protein [Clostridium sp. A1-XYC3]MDW8800699.1 ABC transporter ATP-binding protein [Clostridium sp. A1-XYC3]